MSAAASIPRSISNLLLLGAFALVALILAVGAPTAGAGTRAPEVEFVRLNGYPAPGTPPAYNKVGVLKVGREHARNVLILNPGTSASAAYFAPLAKTIAQRAKRWQVWAVERRENLLEDHSVADRVRAGGPRRACCSTTTSVT